MDYYERHGRNAALTCRYVGISRQTFYRWPRRYKPRHIASLEERSCRPTPTATPVTPTATPVTPTATPFSEVSPTIVIPTPTPPKEKGDVNCDGVVTIEDAQLIAQLLLGLIDELPCPDQADVNKDGRTSINDAQLIAQLVIGTIPDFGY